MGAERRGSVEVVGRDVKGSIDGFSIGSIGELKGLREWIEISDEN